MDPTTTPDTTALPSTRGSSRPSRAALFTRLCRELRQDEALAMLGYEPLRFDLHRWQPCFGRHPIGPDDVECLHERLSDKWRARNRGKVPLDQLNHAIKVIARGRPVHPLAEELRRTVWDGVPRLDRVSREILGVVDSCDEKVRVSLWSKLLRRWMIAVAARVVDPGRPVDMVLVLTGIAPASAAKFFRTLAGPGRFLDTPERIGTAGLRAQLRESWICLWPDIDTLFQSAAASAFASFISRHEDPIQNHFSPPGGMAPRTAVFVATTPQLVSELTGPLARRIWPIPCGVYFDPVLLAAWRDQLWAEALVAVEQGETGLLNAEEELALEAGRGDAAFVHPMKLVLLARMAKVGTTTLEELVCFAYHLAPSGIRMTHLHAAGRILREAGYRPLRFESQGISCSMWTKASESPDGGGASRVVP